MEVLAAGHLTLRLPWSGDTHQSNARPTLRAASRPLCGVLCNVSSVRSAPFRDGRNASMPAHASGGDGGSGGPRAFPPTGGLPSPVLFAARRLFDQAYLKHLQRGSNLSESFPDRSLSCQRRHISKLVQSAEEDGGEGHSRSFLPLFVGVLYACTRVPPAGALFKKKKKPETIDEFSGRIVKLYWPIMQNLGFSGAVGLASGLALRV